MTDTLPEFTVNRDPYLLAQALTNLVDNAINSAPPEARSRCCVSPSRGLGDCVELSVADNEPGIPDCENPSVREKYHRGTRKEKPPGFGLGLSLVEAIARLHRGSMVLSDNDRVWLLSEAPEHASRQVGAQYSRMLRDNAQTGDHF